MPTQPLTQEVRDAIDWVRAQQQQAAERRMQPDEVDPLPSSWLSVPAVDQGRWPLWLDVCRNVMLGPGTMPALGDTRMLRNHVTTSLLQLPSHWDESWGPCSQTHPALSAGRVAELAAFALQQHEGLKRRLEDLKPNNLQEDLLCRALRDGQPPEPNLRLVQPMVSLELRDHGFGALTELQLWRHEDELKDWPADTASLVRSPRAALLPVDEPFADGLRRVQDLLRRVLQPHAPAVSWAVQPLQELGDEGAPAPLPAQRGSSATAALALGALVLLRDHVRDDTPALAALKAQLYDCEPQHAVISAALGDWPEPGENGQAAPWPPLLPVGGATSKLGVVPNVSSAYGIRAVFFSREQTGVGVDPNKHGVPDLGTLARRVADATSSLSPDARKLHAALVAPGCIEANIDEGLLERVAAHKAPTCIRGYLLWRYAVHASGEQQPLGPPVRLHRYFVRLQLRDKLERPHQPQEDLSPAERDQRQDLRLDLQDLLRSEDDELRTVPAWCIQAPPYRGKSTLLCEWEMRCAREALGRNHHRPGDWGEIPLLVPVNQLAQALKDREGQGSFGQRLLAWMQANAPGLPPLPAVLAGQYPTLNLKFRVLFDALDELQVPTQQVRVETERALCAWLAEPGRHHWLPPVFTVRELEKATALQAQAGRWQARPVALLQWRPSDIRRYLLDRLGEPEPAPGRAPVAPAEGRPAARLLKALEFEATDTDDELDAKPLSSFASFCATPGILSAQCTLIEAWPELPLPQRRVDVLLALVWFALRRARQRQELWKDEALLSPGVLQWLEHGPSTPTRGDWRFPPQPGALLQLLAHAADTLQDSEGGRSTVAPLQPLFATLAQTTTAQALGGEAFIRKTWWPAVRATALAFGWHDESGHTELFRFIHPQFQELFAALGLNRDRLPTLDPPDLVPKDEAALAASLKHYGDRFELPRVTPHHERVCMAVAAALREDREAWLRRLLRSGNVPLAASAAAQVQAELEPDGAYPGEGRKGPHPVVQHLRRVMLLRSMDAGSDVRDRLYAGCVVGADESQAALAEHMGGFDDELNEHWQQEWRHFQSGQGRDLRHRLEAGFSLGDLTDNLRYQRVSGTLEDGRDISGVLLKPEQWLWRGEPGSTQKLSYRIGTDYGGEDKERPSWTKDYEPFQFARYPVTVEEWRWFVRYDGYNPERLWWQLAGAAAQEWLQTIGGASTRPGLWEDSRFSNGLQPIIAIWPFEALAYAHWANLLQSMGRCGSDTEFTLARGRIELPTEVRWEAGVWGPEAHPGLRGPELVHQQGHSKPGPIDFNHNDHFGRTAPVGSYCRSAGPAGHFDTAGQVYECCASGLPRQLRYEGWGNELSRRLADARPWSADFKFHAARRGGAFDSFAEYCRPSQRAHKADDQTGLRLVRLFSRHSEHRPY